MPLGSGASLLQAPVGFITTDRSCPSGRRRLPFLGCLPPSLLVASPSPCGGVLLPTPFGPMRPVLHSHVLHRTCPAVPLGLRDGPAAGQLLVLLLLLATGTQSNFKLTGGQALFDSQSNTV